MAFQRIQNRDLLRYFAFLTLLVTHDDSPTTVLQGTRCTCWSNCRTQHKVLKFALLLAKVTTQLAVEVAARQLQYGSS